MNERPSERHYLSKLKLQGREGATKQKASRPLLFPRGHNSDPKIRRTESDREMKNAPESHSKCAIIHRLRRHRRRNRVFINDLLGGPAFAKRGPFRRTYGLITEELVRVR